MIELGIEDMRKNPWLIEHMLGDLVSNPYLSDKYGKKQIEACQEWFRNNQIDVYMTGRTDKDRPPCITIAMGPSNEKNDMKSMADQSVETLVLMPNQIGKPIPFVVKPFVPTGYDQDTGQVSLDPNTAGLDVVTPGMILVNPDTGVGYKIISVNNEGIVIESELSFDAEKLAVVPQYAYYEARVEHSFFQETYKIGCHVHGDPQTLMWLHSIVLYSILRYRESLLEANGFAESTLSNGALEMDGSFSGPGGESGFARYITLAGQVENSWVKSPRRFIEAVVLKDKAITGITGGIKILTNLDVSPIIDPTNQSWFTKEGGEDEP